MTTYRNGHHARVGDVVIDCNDTRGVVQKIVDADAAIIWRGGIVYWMPVSDLDLAADQSIKWGERK